MAKPRPAETLQRLSELLGNDPVALVRRARSAGLDIPEDLAAIRPAEYYTGRYRHSGTVREACDAAGVDINDYYQLKGRQPGLTQNEILAQLTGGQS